MTVSLHSTTLAFFENDGWYPTAEADEITVAVTGRTRDFMCFAHTFEDRGLIVFFAVAPFLVPGARSVHVMEFVNQANWGLMVGNFELHAGDGLVRYRTSVDLESVAAKNRTESLVTDLVRDASHTAAAMLDQHMAALVDVIEHGRDPLDALREMEL